MCGRCLPAHAGQQKLGLLVEEACGGAAGRRALWWALEVGLSDEGLRERCSGAVVGAEGAVVGVVVGDKDDEEGKGRESRPARRLLFRRRSRSAASSPPVPHASSAAGAPKVAVTSLGRRGEISSTVTDCMRDAGRQARAVVSTRMQGRSSVAISSACSTRATRAVVSTRMQGRSSVAISVPGRAVQADKAQPFAPAHQQGT